MINLSRISKVYEVGDESVPVLKDITVSIEKKEFIGIIGASGSGKSTLMHIIGLLDSYSSGKMKIDGKDISTLSDSQISRLRSEYFGFVFQQFNLIDKLTVEENILLPSVYCRKKLTFDPRKRSEELMKRFGIWERRAYFPNKISGGQQQRVAIARALILMPEVILADEPTGNLDSRTGREILLLLEELNRRDNTTVVIVTHDKEVANRTRKKIFIKDGLMVDRL